MLFELDIDGRRRAVNVERVSAGDHRFRVTLDGLTRTVDAVELEGDTISLILPDAGFASHVVSFADGQHAGALSAYVDGVPVQVVVNGRRARRSGETAVSGQQQIAAPMPGKILRVLVAAGDDVIARQPLVVVEAMKMENELTSPKAGRVKDVLVSAGVSVEAGRLLVVVE